MATPLTEGTYKVEIVDENGGTICDFSDRQIEGEFARSNGFVVNGASITVDQESCADCEDCEPIERRHELKITRDDWTEPAFIGPFLRQVDDPLQRTIRYVAQSRLYWWAGAPAVRGVNLSGPVVDVLRSIFLLADEYEESGLDFDFTGRGAPTPPNNGVTIETSIAQDASVLEKVLSLAKSTFDGTVVGRDLYWGAPAVAIEAGPPLDTSHWKDNPPITDRDGSDVGTRVIVAAAGGIVASFPATEVDLGFRKRTIFVSDSNLDDQAEADAFAEEIYNQNTEPTNFLVTGEGSLNETAPLSLHELIPGRLHKISAQGQCLTTEETLQLTNVIVQFGTEVVKGQRTIAERRVAVDFQRPGTQGSAERASA